MKRFLFILLMALVLPVVSMAQTNVEKHETVRVYFRQGSSVLEQDYMGNRDALNQLAELLKPYLLEGESVSANGEGRVRIVSSASPEGLSMVNERLVNARAKVISDWVSNKFKVKVDYTVESMGVDWMTLETLVAESNEVPNRNGVLEILRNASDAERHKQLERLDGGVPYRWIYKNLFPKLRYAAAYTEIWYATGIRITSDVPVRFGAAGGAGVVTFEKDIDDKVVPEASAPVAWISAIEPSSDDVAFVVAPNTVAAPRESVVTIACYGETYDVLVVQDGAEPKFGIAAPKAMGCGAGTEVIPYESNGGEGAVPRVTTDAPWISDIVVDDEAKTITYSYAANGGVDPRTANLEVECMGEKHAVALSQAGVEPSLTITSARDVEYPAEGAEDKISFEKRVADDVVPTATTTADWIESVVPTEDGVTYTVKENPTEEPRTASIFVESYGEKHEVVVNQQGAKSRKPFYMSIQTNMLYDLAIVPNISAEIYFGGNVSLDVNWHYSWWKSDKKSWYWRTYGGDAAVRYWLGKQSRIKPLTGHHLGLYGQLLTYDFEVGKGGILADKWSYTVGLEYGYSLPIGRRLNLDFTIGAGYHWGLFDEYLPIDGHYVWQATKRRQYFGPTKLEVSLVWLIGYGNYNKDRGGKR